MPQNYYQILCSIFSFGYDYSFATPYNIIHSSLVEAKAIVLVIVDKLSPNYHQFLIQIILVQHKYQFLTYSQKM
jgi:hypothetical protein